MTIEDINNRMLELSAAASDAITHWSDVRVRGYLKEHPDLVEQSVDRLEHMLAVVRHRIAVERARDLWNGPLPDGVAVDHFAEMATAFAEHSCDCEWCLCARPAGVGDEPIYITLDPA